MTTFLLQTGVADLQLVRHLSHAALVVVARCLRLQGLAFIWYGARGVPGAAIG